MKRAPLLLAIASAMLCAAPAAAPVRFGVSTFAAHSVNLPIIPATQTLLEDLLGEENIIVTQLPIEELSRRVKAGDFDMILTSAGGYRRLAIEGAGVRDLASAASARAPNPNYADGSVIFVRADSPVKTIEDLKARRIAANHARGFSGWQTALGELYARGIDYQTFFSRIDFTNHDMAEVVRRVEDGRSDAGVVRACFMEDMNLTLSRFRILGERKDGLIRCAHSTALYPNWVISTLPSLSPDLSRRIGAALFSMPPVADGVHWSIATDFRAIDDLFKNLKIGPYEYLQTFSFRRFAAENWPFLAIGLTLLVALILHSVTVSALVRRRTRELEASLARESELMRETEAAQSRFLSLQKVGIVGQMSSIIAHELRQPLAAISMQAFGLLRRFENGTATEAAATASLTRITQQTDRASAIVDQVRAYAKGDRKRGPIELNAAVAAAVAEARKSLRSTGVEIRFRAADTAQTVVANPLEIDLIVMNILKNAVEAVAGDDARDAPVTCTVTAAADGPGLRIENPGRVLTDARWETILADSLVTSKKRGLGLGLSIVRSLTDDLGGRLAFDRPASGGLSVSVTFPSAAS